MGGQSCWSDSYLTQNYPSLELYGDNRPQDPSRGPVVSLTFEKIPYVLEILDPGSQGVPLDQDIQGSQANIWRLPWQNIDLKVSIPSPLLS